MALVLVGESNRELSGDLCSALERHKLSYLAAYTGEEVLYYVNRGLRGSDEPLSLIIMDANIRGLSGYAVMTRLSTMEGGRSAPVVFTVERYLRNMLEEGFALGVFGFFVKPVNPAKAVVTLKAIIDGDTAKLRKACHSHGAGSILIKEELLERIEKKK